MLTLKNIVKNYVSADTTVAALAGVSMDFREHEFVSILGPSGCGKTTLLNIIGGLDHYTEGDLVISGRSTKEFTDSDWDAYRNHSIGFVFQSYNLIPHQSVLSNVELALTLSGVSKSERRRRAKEALERVGLGDQLHKRPNQMSGGQMQRVAIARALVNDPEILLADEPTGALDSETSVQVMDILKEISHDKLIIMVTHNPELADKYSSRIIRLLDGKVISDSNPYIASEEKKAPPKTEKHNKKKPSMSFFTALSLSMNNLMTKRGRTLLTSFAGSIGIIGIALILSVSTGVQLYIDRVQEDTLTSYPIQLQAETVDMTALMASLMDIDTDEGEGDKEAELERDRIYTSPVFYDLMNTVNAVETEKNNLKAFRAYLESNEEFAEVLSAVKYSYATDLNIYTKDPDGKIIHSDAQKLVQSLYGMSSDMVAGMNAGMAEMESMSSFATMQIWHELLEGTDGEPISEIVKSQYDIIHGKWPEAYNEAILFVSDRNELSDLTLFTLGFKGAEEMKTISDAAMNKEHIDTEAFAASWSYEEICAKEFKIILNSDRYQKNTNGTYADLSTNETGLSFLYDGENGIDIKIVGIARPNKDAVNSMISSGVGYTAELTRYIIDANNSSDIIKAQLADPSMDVLCALPFPSGEDELYTNAQKAEMIKGYFASLTQAEKAALYTRIASTPDALYLETAASDYLATTDRATLQASMITAYAQQMGTDDTAAIEAYFAKMDDIAFAEVARDLVKQQITAQYTAQVQASLGTLSTDALAAMLDTTPYTEEQYAEMFDLYMPATVSDSTYEDVLATLGYVDPESPSAIMLYASSFENKDKIADLISTYNDAANEDDEIQYTDYVALMMSSITTVINAISYVLIAFVAISLVVSSIMIGIITYISVLERTKEIGILRAIGASKKDISRVFNAETLIVGFSAGVIGIGVTLLLTIPINYILRTLTGIAILGAELPVGGAIVLVIISMVLTFIAGLIPSGVAAKKDPVEALRTE